MKDDDHDYQPSPHSRLSFSRTIHDAVPMAMTLMVRPTTTIHIDSLVMSLNAWSVFGASCEQSEPEAATRLERNMPQVMTRRTAARRRRFEERQREREISFSLSFFSLYGCIHPFAVYLCVVLCVQTHL
jgi:hypothetical protein